MPLWKEQPGANKDPMSTTTAAPPEIPVKREFEPPAEPKPAVARTPTPAPRDMKESVIAAGITITGKIDGAGHVRLAGRFEGDVHIDGNLTIDSGAKLTGGVRAKSVTIGGEIEGNIESAESVELLPTGVLTGDLKAGTLTVAAGSRMRGRAEFGWQDEHAEKAGFTLGARQAS